MEYCNKWTTSLTRLCYLSTVLLSIFIHNVTPQDCSGLMREQRCIELMPETLSWGDANTTCVDRGARLYAPTNSEDLLAFESHMTASSITNAWVGVKQETKEPSWWRWMTACQGCLEDTIRTVCQEEAIDLAFVMDASTSGVGTSANFELIKSFTVLIASHLTIGTTSSDSRVAFVTYAGSATVAFNLGDHDTRANTRAAIEAIPFPVEPFNDLSTALSVTRQSVFEPATGGRRKVAIVLTAANQTRNHATTREEAENLRAAGVTILSIGVSGVPDMMVVKDISSARDDQKTEGNTFWSYNTFTDLASVTYKSSQIIAQLCTTGPTDAVTSDDYTLQVLNGQGCYRDDLQSPELSEVYSDTGDPAVTLTDDLCSATCQQRGKKVAGVQRTPGGIPTCSCGDTFGSIYDPSQSERACTIECPGNSERLCGGIGLDFIFLTEEDGYGYWTDFHPRKESDMSCGYLASAAGSLGIKFQLASAACSEMKKYICEVPIMRCHLAVNDPSYVLYRGACYHFSVVALPWHTGKGACQGLEGDLMSIDAEEEMSLIRAYLLESGRQDEDHWVSLQRSLFYNYNPEVDADQELDFTTVSYFGPSEPGLSEYGCIMIGNSPNYYWFEEACDDASARHRFFCEEDILTTVMPTEPDLSSEAPNTTVLSTAEVTTAPARTRSSATPLTVLTTVVPDHPVACTSSADAETTVKDNSTVGNGSDPDSGASTSNGDSFDDWWIIALIVLVILIILIVILIIIVVICYRKAKKEQKVHPEDDDKFDARKEATIPDSSEVGGAAKVFIEPDAPETGSQVGLVSKDDRFLNGGTLYTPPDKPYFPPDQMHHSPPPHYQGNNYAVQDQQHNYNNNNYDSSHAGTSRSMPLGSEAMQPAQEVTLPISGRVSQSLHPEPTQKSTKPSSGATTPILEEEYRSPAQEFHDQHNDRNASSRGHPPPEVTPRPLKSTPPNITTPDSQMYDEFGNRKTHASQFVNGYAEQGEQN